MREDERSCIYLFFLVLSVVCSLQLGGEAQSLLPFCSSWCYVFVTVREKLGAAPCHGRASICVIIHFHGCFPVGGRSTGKGKEKSIDLTITGCISNCDSSLYIRSILKALEIKFEILLVCTDSERREHRS